jgi:putative hydrolase of the HAD superfamily
MAPYQHVYVADNPNKDFEAPAALGWLTVRIRHPEGLHATTESKPDSPPDFDITSLSQLIDLFPCHREKSA